MSLRDKIPYDREKLIKDTRENPTWIHFGGGNIFRAFQARDLDIAIRNGVYDKGVIVVSGYDHEIIDKVYKPFDDIIICVTLKSDGTVEKDVLGSVCESLKLGKNFENDFNRLKEIFRKKSLQVVSFTITEKGYDLSNVEYLSNVTLLLYERYINGGKTPISFVSMDNCSHNGDKLKNTILHFANIGIDNGIYEKEFIDYINNSISFPCTMIDKITPRPDDEVRKMIEKDFSDVDLNPIITSKKTYIASFVNAEECEYLVIEDNFKNGRPPFEKMGFIMTDRETVDKVEKMKVCTCLNPLHTALAIFGCLLGYNKISEEMKDVDLCKLVKNIGYVEGLPVVVNPGIISPQKFIDEVVNKRVPNPFMPDTPQRIATDTSQKIPIRYGETLKAYEKGMCNGKKAKDLVYIPLVFAGYMRYLMGINDKGEKFELSPDPNLSELTSMMKDIKYEDSSPDNIKIIENVADKFLSNEKIFALDLTKIGLKDKVVSYFIDMNKEKNGIRNTLKKILK